MSTTCNTEYQDFDLETAKLLKNVADEYGLKDCKIRKSNGSMKGDGYLGVITTVEISAVNGALHLVVKNAVKDNNVRKEVPMVEIYQREIYVYNTIIPAMQRLLTEKHLPHFSGFAKCYKTTMISDSETLILENLKTKGFKVWERRLPMNEEHTALVMKEYGRFHALSFALKHQDPAKFDELTKDMDDMLHRFVEKGELMDMWMKECDKLAEFFNTTCENEELGTVFKKFISEAPEYLKNIFVLTDEYSVVLHGDCWVNNMLFRYADSSRSNTPTQVCFIDLQLSKLAPPVLDAAYFFYSCSSKTVLDNHQHYLDLYYTSISDYLKQLGCDPEELYPHSVFLRQWKDFAKFGLLISVIIIKLMLKEPDEVTEYVDFNELGASNVFSGDISRSEEFNERMKNLVLHFIKNDYL